MKTKTTKNEESEPSFNLFNDLSNESRRKILQILLEGNFSLQSISSKIHQSNQSISGHLRKLVDSGLIAKLSDGSFSLTDYGKLILIKIPSFEFITKHEDFFEDHTFGDTPSWLLNCIGMLSGGEYVDGAVVNFVRWKKMIEESNDFFYGIFTQTPHQIATPLAQKLSQGLKIKLIFGKNGLMSDYAKLAQQLQFDKTTLQETMERRIADSVFVNIMITENQACIMFPDRKNQTDVGRIFISKNTDFRQWCLDFFNQKWNSAESFSRFRNFN